MSKRCACGELRTLIGNDDPKYSGRVTRCPVKRGRFVAVKFVPACHRNRYEQAGRFNGGRWVLPFHIRRDCYRALTQEPEAWLWIGQWDQAPIGSKWHQQTAKVAQPMVREKQAERVAEPSVQLVSVEAS